MTADTNASVMDTDRGVSPVIGNVLMVAIAVVLVATISGALVVLTYESIDTNEKPIPVGSELTRNGGFEDGYDGAWEDGFNTDLTASSDTITTQEPYSGSYALKIDGTPGFVGQDITSSIQSGTPYRMCARSKVTDPDGSVYIGIQYYDVPDPSGVTPIEKATYEVDWTEYRDRCVISDFDDDQPVKSAEVWVYYGSGPGTAYVDDVSLKRVRYLADPDRDTDDTRT